MQRAAGAAAPVAAHDPALDRRRPPGLDQLLADRPGERLERLGPPARPQPRLAADHRPDQRIPAKAAVERRSGRGRCRARSASARCAVSAASRRGGLGPKAAPHRQPPRRAPRTCSSAIQSARVSAPSRATITPSRPGLGSRYGPAGTTSLLDCGGYRSFRRWTSTRNEREAATSTFLPRPRPPPRRSDCAALRPAQDPHEQEGQATPSRKPPVRGRDRGGKRDLAGRARSGAARRAPAAGVPRPLPCSGSGRARLRHRASARANVCRESSARTPGTS